MPALIKTEPGVPRKVRVARQSWASGVTAATTPTVNVRGKVVQLEAVVSNATNGITFTVAITTANSGTLFSQASIPENASTVYDTESAKGTPDANFNPFYVSGVITLTCTPSGDPGASGVTLDVILTII